MVIKNSHNGTNLERILKQQRQTIPLTLRQLSESSGVSSSHLGRIERGERFPSAHVLHRIARPLGFEESEIMALAGYLSPQPPTAAEEVTDNNIRRLDPVTARMLAEEPVEVQRAVLGLLAMLKSIARTSAES